MLQNQYTTTMRHLKYLAFVACLGSLSPALAQNASKSLTIDDLVTWQRITDREISDNGKWVACKMEPWEGDATVYLYAAQGQETATFSPADKFAFSASSGYLVVTQTPGKSTVDSLKILKTKEDKMPMNTLVIYSVAGKKETIDSLKTFKLADEADWIAYQRGRKDSTLYVRSLDGSKTFQFPTVTDFQFAKKSGMLYYTSAAEGEAGIFTLNPEKGSPALIKEGKGVFKQTTFDEKGERLAFLYCADKDSSYKALSLWLSEHNAPAKEIATRGNKAFPAEWVINENGMLQFSKSASRLFFGTSPEPRQKDTTQLAENRPNVQVWSWDEPVQYTVQNYNKEKDLKKSYQAVYIWATALSSNWRMRNYRISNWVTRVTQPWRSFPLPVPILCLPCGRPAHAATIIPYRWITENVSKSPKRIMAVSASPHKVNMRIGMARRIVAGTRSPWRKVSDIA